MWDIVNSMKKFLVFMEGMIRMPLVICRIPKARRIEKEFLEHLKHTYGHPSAYAITDIGEVYHNVISSLHKYSTHIVPTNVYWEWEDSPYLNAGRPGLIATCNSGECFNYNLRESSDLHVWFGEKPVVLENLFNGIEFSFMEAYLLMMAYADTLGYGYITKSFIEEFMRFYIHHEEEHARQSIADMDDFSVTYTLAVLSNLEHIKWMEDLLHELYHGSKIEVLAHEFALNNLKEGWS